MGRPDYILGQFRETARRRDANLFVSICQHYHQSALLAVLCCHLATEIVMNFATSKHGGGVCCAFAPQFVLLLCSNPVLTLNVVPCPYCRLFSI